MRNVKIIISIFVILLIGCKKDEPDFSYDSIVDSSFYCKATVNNENFIFPFHDLPTFGTEIYGDSILIKAFLNYRESNDPYANLLWITISKKFKITELTYSINNHGIPYSSGDISNEEFQSLFQNQTNHYSYFDCSLPECNKLDGVEISLQSYMGTTFKTEYIGTFVDKENLNSFNKNTDFKIDKIEWLAKNVVVLEGKFNTDIYSFYGNLITIRDGYFKAYSNNIELPKNFIEDLKWNN